MSEPGYTREPAPRRPTNVSLDAELLAHAKELGINVSRACEQGLAEEVRRRREQRWREENRDALEAYNARIEKYGLLSSHFHDYGAT